MMKTPVDKDDDDIDASAALRALRSARKKSSSSAEDEKPKLPVVDLRALRDQRDARRESKRIKRTVVMTFGRFNPPTTGHLKVWQSMERLARMRQADAVILVTSTMHPLHDPVPVNVRVGWIRRLMPTLVCQSTKSTAPYEIERLCRVFDEVLLVVGSDQATSFQALCRYFPKLRIVCVEGTRDDRAEGVAGVSATRMRLAARQNDYPTFRTMVPSSNDRLATEMFQLVRRYMRVEDDV